MEPETRSYIRPDNRHNFEPTMVIDNDSDRRNIAADNAWGTGDWCRGENVGGRNGPSSFWLR
jgi:hypothetical protein